MDISLRSSLLLNCFFMRAVFKGRVQKDNDLKRSRNFHDSVEPKGFSFFVIKVNKSVYVAKLGQRYDKRLNNFLLHVPNHALKDMYMFNYGTTSNANSSYYSFIKMLIDLINSFSLESELCLLNVLSVSSWLKIPAT